MFAFEPTDAEAALDGVAEPTPADGVDDDEADPPAVDVEEFAPPPAAGARLVNAVATSEEDR
jgi:hypothetical protein